MQDSGIDNDAAGWLSSVNGMCGTRGGFRRSTESQPGRHSTQVKVNDDTPGDEIHTYGHFRCRDSSRVAA